MFDGTNVNIELVESESASAISLTNAGTISMYDANESDLPDIGDYAIRVNDTYAATLSTDPSDSSVSVGYLTDGEYNGRTYWYFTKEIAYPIGYGLSYTNFTYSNLQLSDTSLTPNDTLTVSFDVTNTGTALGKEVGQVYISSPDAYTSDDRPFSQLKGFDKQEIAAGETAHYSIEIPMEETATVEMVVTVSPEDSSGEPEHTHSYTSAVTKESTCTEAGNIAYWTCSVCGTIFTDEAGTLSALPTATRSGYTLKYWLNGDEEVTLETVFTEDTTLTAVWSKVSTSSGGSSSGSSSSSSTTTDEEETTEDTTVDQATLNEEATGFKDVAEADWHAEYIAYVVEQELFQGVSTNEFTPNDTMTRAMLFTVLFRHADAETEAEGEEWYAAQMAWAVGAGILNGNTNGELSPQGYATRGEVAAMVTRFCQ